MEREERVSLYSAMTDPHHRISIEPAGPGDTRRKAECQEQGQKGSDDVRTAHRKPTRFGGFATGRPPHRAGVWTWNVENRSDLRDRMRGRFVSAPPPKAMPPA